MYMQLSAEAVIQKTKMVSLCVFCVLQSPSKRMLTRWEEAPLLFVNSHFSETPFVEWSFTVIPSPAKNVNHDRPVMSSRFSSADIKMEHELIVVLSHRSTEIYGNVQAEVTNLWLPFSLESEITTNTLPTAHFPNSHLHLAVSKQSVWNELGLFASFCRHIVPSVSHFVQYCKICIKKILKNP